jgi:hypothetical protein
MVEIESVGFGEVKVDGRSYFSDVVVWWDGRVDYRPKSVAITFDDYTRLLARAPEIIVVGGGKSAASRIDESIVPDCENRDIELFTETSKKAAAIFNAFAAQGRRAVAVIRTA